MRGWNHDRQIVDQWWEVQRSGIPTDRLGKTIHFDRYEAVATRDATRAAYPHVRLVKITRWSRPVQPNETGACPVHDDQHHGREAEELRQGIDRVIAEHGGNWSRDGAEEMADALSMMLDSVDARDSLAWLERRDRMKRKAAARKGGGR